MKKITLLIALFFLCTIAITAQQKKYISYEIKRGETLKSIAKTYKLSTRDLSKLNPGVSKKPAMGTIIIVPNKNYGKTITNVISETPKGYIVKPKETLFGISKKFGISIDELTAVNPALTDGLKIGMELVIPEPTIAQVQDSINYVMHTVVKDDTMFNLTRRFDVTENELNQLNPTLTEGLKLGMLLKIKQIDPILIEDLNSQDSVAVFIENLQFDRKIKLAVILPYQLNKLQDSLIDQSFEKSNSILNIATDFHLGAVMAIDSLKRKGLKIDVSYFDSENSNQKLQRILKANDHFSDTDLIIGPLFFDKAHNVAKQTKAKVIAPIFSKKQYSLNSANLIKSAPNTEVYQEKLLKHIETSYNGENILVVNDGKAETQTQLWQIVSKLKAFDSIKNISVIKPKEGYIDREIFSKNLDSTTKNLVILISDENVTTSTTVNNLKGFAENIDIDLFSLNKGKNFDNIDNSFLGKLNFVYPTSTFFNTEDRLTTSFYNAYYKKNYAYPSKYAIRGFDVTYDAIVRFASYEEVVEEKTGLEEAQEVVLDEQDESIKQSFSEERSTRVSSVFGYTKNAFGSLENNQVILIQYNEDLTTKIIE